MGSASPIILFITSSSRGDSRIAPTPYRTFAGRYSLGYTFAGARSRRCIEGGRSKSEVVPLFYREIWALLLRPYRQTYSKNRDALTQFLAEDASEYMNRLRRDEVLAVLRHHKAELAERYGVISLGVFGSVARDEAKEDSDVDIVIQMSKPDLFLMVHIKELLEEALNCPVDIIRYRERLNPRFKQSIDVEAIYV